MKPVVPKICVGDVLCGTKNLRNYLRTSSFTNYLDALSNGETKSIATRLLYTPKKNDRFIVTVNRDNQFMVWSNNKNIALLFYNGLSRVTPDLALANIRPRMNAQLFAQWFTRTKARHPDTQLWPPWAYYLWASVQMNARNNKSIKLRFRLYTLVNEQFRWRLPFDIHRLQDHENTDTINRAVKESIITGNFRTSKQIINEGIPLGPHLRDLDTMKEYIHKYLKDPRIKHKIKKHSEVKDMYIQFGL